MIYIQKFDNVESVCCLKCRCVVPIKIVIDDKILEHIRKFGNEYYDFKTLRRQIPYTYRFKCSLCGEQFCEITVEGWKNEEVGEFWYIIDSEMQEALNNCLQLSSGCFDII